MQDALSLNTTIPNAILQCIRSASCDKAPLVPVKSHNVVVMSWFYVGAQRNIGVGGVWTTASCQSMATPRPKKKKKACTQMGMHTSNGTSVRHWTSGLVKRWGGVCRVLCYSFIPLCCPLVLIMVASFKFQTDMLQKQSCPLYAQPLLVWDLVHGTKRVYICACVCAYMCVCVYVGVFGSYKSAFPSVCCLSLSLCSSICQFAYVHTGFFSLFSIFFFCNWWAFLCLCVWCACQRVRLAMYAWNGSALFFPGTAAIGLDWCVTQAGTLKGERLGQTWSC